ncbi:hypothetical protein PFTANZ_06003, partial [Plasmodium falciparum Tanzania (2000708)]
MAQGGSGGGGGNDYSDAKDAKDLLDRIGKDVYDKVKEEAEKRSNGDLKAYVSFASIFGRERPRILDPCNLKSKYTELIKDNRNRYPCGNGSASDKRFSVKQQAEYDNKKMKCSNGGACAPYRRLHLCHHNLETINNTTSTAKHDLLAEVCMAAYYEGDLIKTRHRGHQLTNVGTSSQLCTVLARSFADIGDIIRGRDLYSGNSKEKKKRDELDDKLKKIFGKIHDKLKDSIKSNYNNDTENYYKLREDWWTANRSTVWEALTCDAPDDSKYFRGTCGSGKTATQARDKCRCSDNQVPTYFDYVPQYLRWFEEWAEDFCRKKNKKIKDAKNKCREGQDQSGGERYCDFNGYDCKGTFRGINMYRWDHKCTGCFLSCSHFRTWIDNQKEQFDKQKKIYDKEMQKYTKVASRSSRQRRAARSSGSNSNYDGYEKKFYDILNGRDVGGLDKFLQLLNEENECKGFKEDEGTINFKTVNSGSASGDGDSSNKTFSHTEYCQACPWCGVEKKNENWERKESMDKCPPINLYKPINVKSGTPINFLYSGDEATEIGKKLKKFCDENKNGDNKDASLYQEWTCYHVKQLEKENKENGVDNEDYDNDVQTGGGLCILQKTNGLNVNKQKTFNPFFYYWVVHMLKDSIHWRTEKLDKCINNSNESKACKNNNKCKDNCDCFQRWVKQKKDEWKPIKEHFRKQEGIVQQHGFMTLTHDAVLQTLLKKDLLLEIIQDVHGDTDDIKRIEELLDDDAAAVAAVIFGGEDNTTIDKLLQHEENDAKECLRKQEECKPKTKPTAEDVSRSLKPEEDHGSDSEEEEDEVEDTEATKAEDNNAVEETVAETTTEGSTTTTQNEVNPCEIVKTLFSNTTKFSDACALKYVTGKNYGWKCVPSGKPGEPTSESSSVRGKRSAPESGSNSDKNGSICIPPRRRKLYIQKLHDWASDETTKRSKSSQGGSEEGEGTKASASSSSSDSNSDAQTASDRSDQTTSQPNSHPAPPSHLRDGLRDAFIQSAAIETFFLWHRYKKIKDKEKKEKQAAQNHLVQPETSDDEEQKQLNEGNIPEEFKRQMFYTLGDYRDICIGDEKVIQMLKANGDNNIETINKKIKTILNGDKPSGPPPDQLSEKLKSWWENNAKYIWEGMICALTYKESGEKGKAPEQNEKVRKAFFGDKDKVNPGTTSGKYKEKYEYDEVKLEDENGGTKTDTNNQPLTLKNFVERPPYFRYLEEWGETFCRERTRRLGKIKEECKVEENGRRRLGGTKNPKCSCYGEDCEEIFSKHYNTLPSFDCPKCGKYCRFYRKWIERKGKEFDKQKKAFPKQKDNYVKESINHDKEFCAKLKTNYTGAAAFLKTLGSCKNDSEEGKNIFEDTEKTFGPSPNCKPCSEFKINCQNGNCDTTKGEECKGNKISAEKFDTMGQPTDINMLVSDSSKNEFEGNLEACGSAGIFQGIRKEEWKCRNVCGYVVCKPENFNDGTYAKVYIQIRELIKRWVEYFFDDYNKIKRKISHCINNENGSICTSDCGKKWVEKKRVEWGKITQRLNEQYKRDNQPDYSVKTILEELIPQIPVANAKNYVIKLSKFGNSCGCSAKTNSENNKNEDAIECMLKKLGEKAKECKEKHSGQTCSPAPPETPEDEEEELEPLEEEENPENIVPKICEDVIKAPTEPVVESGCEPENEKKKEKEKEEQEVREASEELPISPEPEQETTSSEGTEHHTEVKPEEKATVPAGTPPSTPAAPPAVDHPQADEPSKPIGDILSSTIPFGIAIALTSIVFLFLK